MKPLDCKLVGFQNRLVQWLNSVPIFWCKADNIARIGEGTLQDWTWLLLMYNEIKVPFMENHKYSIAKIG